jgi:hypothetical protein
LGDLEEQISAYDNPSKASDRACVHFVIPV